ncbi:hypothetical protein GDO78_014755 [Eleutherodactylus coqui]|uniref:Uncharacterized protein n=1 Tax=Eleutherodactylus coqui TaxID=57060 RepID=A0A8J6E472_ELECQ|nr:hypothetical protein GDO78_014755 [Eleutherodactylus coqui]
MSFHIHLWLLLTLSAVAADYSSYIPQLIIKPFQGRVTATTFILDKPQCLFDRTSTNNVWLFVANKTGKELLRALKRTRMQSFKKLKCSITFIIFFHLVQLDNNQLSKSAPYSSFSSLGYYRTLRTVEKTFPCNDVANYIRVGSETSCSDSDNCNGPLISPGPYRVKFVVLDSNGALVDQTGWSGPITLHQGKRASSIDTWPGGRSGGMIVITSILSILLATFLVCLIGTFIVGRKNIICCKRTEEIENTVPQVVNMKNYKTHHAPENTDLCSQPVA